MGPGIYSKYLKTWQKSWQLVTSGSSMSLEDFVSHIQNLEEPPLFILMVFLQNSWEGFTSVQQYEAGIAPLQRRLPKRSVRGYRNWCDPQDPPPGWTISAQSALPQMLQTFHHLHILDFLQYICTSFILRSPELNTVQHNPLVYQPLLPVLCSLKISWGLEPGLDLELIPRVHH